jgi:hypothetical protein
MGSLDGELVIENWSLVIKDKGEMRPPRWPILLISGYRPMFEVDSNPRLVLMDRIHENVVFSRSENVVHNNFLHAKVGQGAPLMEIVAHYQHFVGWLLRVGEPGGNF